MRKKEAPSDLSAIELSASVKIRLSPVELTLCVVTADQIEGYGELGLLVSVFLTLFGIANGAAIGFWVAVRQGGLPPVGEATLTTAMWASVVFVVVTFVFTDFFHWRQRKCRREWFTSREEM